MSKWMGRAERLIASCLAVLMIVPALNAVTTDLPSAPQPQQLAQSQTQLPSPDAAGQSAQQSQQPASATQSGQQNQTQPVGTAVAPVVKPEGVPASRPAGAAIAPAKQRRVRTFAIRV